MDCGWASHSQGSWFKYLDASGKADEKRPPKAKTAEDMTFLCLLFALNVNSIGSDYCLKNLIGEEAKNHQKGRPGLSDRFGLRSIVLSVGRFCIFWYSLFPSVL